MYLEKYTKKLSTNPLINFITKITNQYHHYYMYAVKSYIDAMAGDAMARGLPIDDLLACFLLRLSFVEI